MKLVVVAAFVALNAVGFLAYRELHAPDAAASSLPTSKHEAAETLSREPGTSQAKPVAPPVAAQPTPEPDAAPAISAQPIVPDHTDSPTGETTTPTPERNVQPTRVKRPAHRRAEVAAPTAKPAPIAKPAAVTKPAVVASQPAAESKPAAETKPAETKPADKPKDKVLEMDANPYKRGE
jgi:hypothetical protein